MDLSVEDLCGLLKRSRLVTPVEVHALYDRWIVEGADKTSTTQFTKWLVQTNRLTEYQAMLLAKGMVDDFFLGDYKIVDRLGRGRMAGVYKAKRADGRLFAIKVLPPSRTKIPALMARFHREAKLALSFNHPNVVRSHDFGESKGNYYLVMELLDGENVEEVLLRRKRLPMTEAVDVIHQALLGLQHLHELGVVHRDLKPANLMLCPAVRLGEPDTVHTRTVKILDIGLARQTFENPSLVEKGDPTDVTQEGVLLGTPDYLSPEQARDPRAIDIRSDIYSLGCVLYHLLTGRTPFPDGNILNLMIRHATETPRPLRELIPGFPDTLQSIVDRMTAKAADQRFATPAAAAEALQKFLDDSHNPTTAPPTAPPPQVVVSPVPSAPSLPTVPRQPKGPPKKSGKFAVGQPHLPPASVEIELVPLAPSSLGSSSPSAALPTYPTSEFQEDIDVETVIVARPRQSSGNRAVLIVGIVLGILAFAIAGVVIALRGR